MGKDFSGLKAVHHGDDNVFGNATAITGKISTDSSFTPDNIKTETTDGQSFGGGSIQGEIYFLDNTDFATVEGFMENDTEKYWFFEYKDGRVLRTTEKINPFTRPGMGVNARDGAVKWIMDFEKYGHQVAVTLVP
ncbi:hypothetical protein [Gracilimonas tropica]|uniref:hypothetical protein n=1 Tax=Gracilimonas tropica TaxID=454600 RepID=UPI0003617391|nr:hypothetical protein [Gracilimonas tropica]